MICDRNTTALTQAPFGHNILNPLPASHQPYIASPCNRTVQPRFTSTIAISVIFTERFHESSIVHPVIVAQAAGKAPAKGPELLAELPYMDPTVLAIRHMNFTHGNHNQSKAIQIPRVNMIKRVQRMEQR